MMTGTVGKRAATAASASGSPSRRSNGDGKAELLADADGQHAAVHEHGGAARSAAASNVAATRSSSRR